MPFDGFVTRALVKELDQNLKNKKINKIYQPHQTDLVFILRGAGKNFNLLISANPTYPRIYLTEQSFTNPMEPPMFCMLLRKHIEGGIIEEINQVEHERVITMDIRVRDDLGDIQTKRLIIEIMGKHSNIILLNLENNQILDGINHVTPAISRHRIILPGKEYIAPPKQDKANPLEVDYDKFFSLVQFNAGKLDQQLVDQFTGLSPAVAKEIIYQAGLPQRENVWASFHQWMNKVRDGNYNHAITYGEKKEEFSIFPLTHISDKVVHYDNINTCLKDYYNQKAERDVVKQRSFDLAKLLQNEKQKNKKKTEVLLKDLDKTKEAEKYKLYGELITANLHQINRGEKEIEVINYYDEDQQTIKIPLNSTKTPNDNAQNYFRKYNKLKGSIKYIEEQIEKTKKEIEYLETVLTTLENASVDDIEEIREELMEEGYIKKKKKGTKKKNTKPKIEQYKSSEDHIIYVGKNNKQNEYLTQKIASANDTWLHTKDIPGSHVVIKAKDFGEQTLKEAATLAAFYSKAKNSSNVPVDYTLIKHVKKPSGSKPGFVIYDNQKTLYVTPDEDKVEHLKF